MPQTGRTVPDLLTELQPAPRDGAGSARGHEAKELSPKKESFSEQTALPSTRGALSVWIVRRVEKLSRSVLVRACLDGELVFVCQVEGGLRLCRLLREQIHLKRSLLQALKTRLHVFMTPQGAGLPATARSINHCAHGQGVESLTRFS
ncbi:hypothetical protein AAFF_G00187070 [Aldrovandia affinis]|uniref:Uncharacterized protein n=1 Tax=Aldrovandia affinis TaxID=143900 RepID=A0AAD7SXV2_9TELE|nr:hypothetical protein AAFF_G00187070 [Aldrovandia affinis]